MSDGTVTKTERVLILISLKLLLSTLESLVAGTKDLILGIENS